jgi:hypothetical protein
VYFHVLGTDYVIYSNYVGIGYKDGGEKYTTISVSAVFDFKTGEKLTFDDILSDGWKNEINWVDKSCDLKDLTLSGFGYLGECYGCVSLDGFNEKTGEKVYFSVPEKYSNIRY